MNSENLKRQALEALAKAHEDRTEAERRFVTEAPRLIEEAKAVEDAVRRVSGPAEESVALKGLGSAANVFGWDPAGGKKAVSVPFDVFAKSDLIATQANANPVSGGGLAAKGLDARYVFAALPNVELALDATRVDFLQQTTRTLANADSMQLALDSSTTKPTTDSVAQLVSIEPIWVANISNPQPNALFAQAALRAMLVDDMTAAYAASVDDSVFESIDAASITTRTQTTETLSEVVRKAITDSQGNGFSPRILAVTPAIAETMDLTLDAVDHYQGEEFATWGMQRVVSSAVPTGYAYVIDPAGITIHRSAVKVESNDSLYFESNRTVARVEGLLATAVKQGAAVTRITLA